MAEMTFTIAGGPGIEVHVEEVDGDLRFTVSVLGEGGLTADLRGLFFQVADESLLGGLTLSQDGAGVTEFRAKEDGVIDLGQGANMQGAAGAFDIGVEIGSAGMGRDDIQSVSFVLSHATADLSLSLIALQEFGVRMTSVGLEGGSRTDGLKLVGTATDVPDGNTPPVAMDDTATTTEDLPVIINVLGNDKDADGDALTVTLDSLTSASGAALTLNDDGTISYDPTRSAALGRLNDGESETDTFTYTITDAHGATSTATVSVAVSGVTDAVEDLFGRALDFKYDFLGTILFDTDVTVSSDLEVPSIQGPETPPEAITSLEITANQLIFSFASAGTYFLDGGFNGIRIQDLSSDPVSIREVTINGASTIAGMVGFDESDISWTADGAIAVDFAGVSYDLTPGPTLILDVIFA